MSLSSRPSLMEIQGEADLEDMVREESIKVSRRDVGKRLGTRVQVDRSHEKQRVDQLMS